MNLSIPAAGVLELWKFDLAIDEEAAFDMAAVLDATERARANRFATARLRTRFVAAHATVRAILGAYLGLTAEAVSFVRSPLGKPHVDGLAFNVSHSGELAVCAVAAGGRCGVDIEGIKSVPDAQRLADRYFSPREAEALRRLPADDLQREFLATWTRKEAFLKATGDGLSQPLHAFDLSSASPRGWGIHAFDPGPGFLGTVAHDRPIAGIACRPWIAAHAAPALMASSA